MVCEALLFTLIIFRFVLFGAFMPGLYRLYKSMARSLSMYGWFFFIIIPALCGIAFLAHTLWSPYMYEFSTLPRTFLTTALACRRSFPHVFEMQEYQNVWTILFLVFFCLSMTVYILN